MPDFNSAFGSFNIKLTDHFQHDQLPFNQADHYLLNTLFNLRENHENLSIVNDQHAALATALEAINPCLFNDAASFKDALKINLINYQDDIVKPYSDIHSVNNTTALLRLPKNLLLFKYLLQQLGKSHEQIIVAGMQKYWPKSFFEAAYEQFDSVEVLPGVKKAKCMILRSPKLSDDICFTKNLAVEEYSLELLNYPGVFSYDNLDIGSRFFLENFPELVQGSRVIDLACGNGVLGIYSQKKFKTHVAYIDDSATALDSCQASLALNQIDSNFTLHHNNCLNDLSLSQVDTVLCNPPFHQQHSISDHIAHKMIQQSKQYLTSSGKLYLIGNRHLAYAKVLQQSFNTVETVAANNKFILLKAF